MPGSAVRLCLALLAAAIPGCAAPYTLHVPSPEEIPALERRSEISPDDPEVLAGLGAAYRGAGRLEDAAEALGRALELDPGSADVRLVLGLTYEDLEWFAEARELYSEYLALRPSGPTARQVTDRLELMTRMEVRRIVRLAVEREAEIADTPPDPTSIAVFPFRFQGGGPELEPLGAALSGMITTDLAQLGRFRVLERLRIEVLFEELALGASGAVDPGTAARGGRILGAGRIVTGQIAGSEESLGIDAAVVALAGPDVGTRLVAARDPLDRIFEVQKELVLDILAAAGVTLTAAERERVTQRRTENLAALLAYGRGIEASLRGDAAEAAREFGLAASLDPGFVEAALEARASESTAAAVATGTAELLQEAVTATASTEDLQREAAGAVMDLAGWNPMRDGPLTDGSSTGIRVILRRPPGGGP